MNNVLLFEYETEERHEYPDMHSLGKITWYEIVDVNFVVCTHKNGLYCNEYGDIITSSFEELCDVQYKWYMRVLNNESHQMNCKEELQYLLELLTYYNIRTKENIEWIHYFVLYQHTRWRTEYEK